MKKLRLFLTLAFLACIITPTLAAPTAKAIYCSANKTLYFTYDEETYTAGSTYTNLDDNSITATKVYITINPLGYSNYGLNIAPWITDCGSECTIIKFLDNFSSWKPTSLSSFFCNMTALTTVKGGGYLNTSDVTNLSFLFRQCESLSDLSFLSTWDVSKAKQLEGAFSYCPSITNVDALANWDLSNVLSFRGVFQNCENLTNLDGLSGWETGNGTNFSAMFSNCNNLADIDGLSGWNTGNGTTFASMFSNCNNLADLGPLSNWDTGKVTSLYQCFHNTSVADLTPLSNWNTENNTTLEATFSGCKNITDLTPISTWDTHQVTTLINTFFGCESLIKLDGISTWNVGNVTSMYQTFMNCTALTNVDGIKNWNTNKVGNMSWTFNNCSSLIGRVDLSKWNLSSINKTGKYGFSPSITGLANMFSGCTKLIGITLGQGNVGSLEGIGIYASFSDCPNLRYIDLSGCTDTYGNIVTVNRSVGVNYYDADMFYTVPRTTVIYLPSGNGQPIEGDLENVVYTASDATLQCDKYYSEDKIDIELPHRFHADAATYERTFNSNYGGVILPYPVKINDTDDEEFQPFLLKKEYTNAMYFEGETEVDANTPFVFKRKGGTSMTFPMSDVWVESTYDVDGQTANNIELDAWNAQGFYTTHEIDPENGKFGIPTKDDYKGTSIVEYDYDRVYYIAGNKFYRADNSTLYLDPHRIVFYGMWDKYTGDDSSAKPYVYDIAETDSQVVTAIEEAEVRMDEENAVEIYDASGNRLSKAQRGLNIMRMSDGSIKKVIKK